MHAFASFRFLDLSDKQAEKLVALIPKAEIGEHYETGKKVGSIELVDNSNNGSIEEFYKMCSFVPTDCDIFISIASENRDEVWRAPKSVNNVLSIINCPIVFSYTC